MFEECLIDIDFNLLVLNVASLSEISYSAAGLRVPPGWVPAEAAVLGHPCVPGSRGWRWRQVEGCLTGVHSLVFLGCRLH